MTNLFYSSMQISAVITTSTSPTLQSRLEMTRGHEVCELPYSPPQLASCITPSTSPMTTNGSGDMRRSSDANRGTGGRDRSYDVYQGVENGEGHRFESENALELGQASGLAAFSDCGCANEHGLKGLSQLQPLSPPRRRCQKIHYDEMEALEVAKTWVKQSESTTNQKGNTFFEGFVNTVCERGCKIRVVESVRALCKRLNKDSRLWISLRA